MRPGRWMFGLMVTVACASPGETGRSDGGSDASTSDTGAPDTRAPDVGACEMTRCGVLCVELGSDPTNCGACGRSCVLPNARAACIAGDCAVAACEPGFSDPNGDPLDGCELDRGDCSPGASCTTSCGTVGATTCDPVGCSPPAETCNLSDDDCDGVCDQGADCRAMVHRAVGNGGHFYTLDLAEAGSGGHTLEFANYYALYRTEQPGTRALNRCRKGNGLRFYTTSTDCEGAGPLEEVMGYLAVGEVCGSRPLYRLYNGGDHFYTVSAAERDNAVATFGYTFESITGYVW